MISVRPLFSCRRSVRRQQMPLSVRRLAETHLLKQFLDIGCQSFVVPMIESAAQAIEMVRATRYPPAGVRGVGASTARASGFNAHVDYLHRQ